MTHQPYQYALSITSQFYFCGIPFRLDTSPKCPLNCAYCFAMSRGGRPTSIQLRADPKTISRKLIAAEKKENGIISEMLRHKVPVHFGGISDPFANKQLTEISLQLLSVLAEAKYPVVLSTKNPSVLLEKRGLEIIQKLPYFAIQISFSTINDTLAREIEPGASAPSTRLRSASILSSLGFFLIASLTNDESSLNR